MLKGLLIKKMLQSKLKELPPETQEKVAKAIEENPQLFESIVKEMQQKVEEGKDQMAAAMEVMQAHQAELQELMNK